MLVYTRGNPDIFLSYNQSYTKDEQHFVLAKSAQNFARGIAERVSSVRDLSVLEVGCGQGDYLSFVQNEIAAHRPYGLPVPSYLGMDGSDVAIAQCNHRFPAFDWVCDLLQDFIREHDARLDHRRYTLILDKSGTTYVKTAEEATRILSAFEALLRPGGCYAYIISKTFYEQRLKPRVYGSWNTDWIRIAHEVFPYAQDMSDTGYYRYLFGNTPPALATLDPRPEPPPRAGSPPLASISSSLTLPTTEAADVGDERYDLLLDLLVTGSVESVELIKWNENIRYCTDILDRLPAPKITVLESLSHRGPFVALRHDCDHSMQNALTMARTEALRGYRATYYLLPPDGFTVKTNYFGSVEKGRLEFSPRLLAAAKYLVDLGHEVGIHNDAITLALFLRRTAEDVLAEQIAHFRNAGIPIRGTAGHGSPLCKTLGYLNSQLFAKLKTTAPAEPYRSSEVTHNGHTVAKYRVTLANLELNYEADYVPKHASFSDSNGVFRIKRKAGDLIKADSAFASQQIIDACVAECDGKFQMLIHPCHWLSVISGNLVTAGRVTRHFTGPRPIKS